MKLKQWVKLIPLSVVASSLCLCAYASSDLEAIMKARNLSEKDILAAAKTYQPSGAATNTWFSVPAVSQDK